MVRGGTYAVFVLPIVFSVIFGSFVMWDILQDSGRELNLMQVGSIGEKLDNEQLEIIGLEKQYTISEPIRIQVLIDDLSFSCGDLYITIYTFNENAVTQSGYFHQCFDTGSSLLPLEERFSEVVDIPGEYKIVVDLLDQNQRNSITIREKFTVK